MLKNKLAANNEEEIKMLYRVLSYDDDHDDDASSEGNNTDHRMFTHNKKLDLYSKTLRIPITVCICHCQYFTCCFFNV
jgi:hypothetical protein